MARSTRKAKDGGSLPTLKDFGKNASLMRSQFGEEKWAELVKSQETSIQDHVAALRGWLVAFDASPEGQARKALLVGLEALREHPVIRQSDTCLDVVGAFIQCVSYRWGAADSVEMLDPLWPFFQHIEGQRAAAAKLAKDPAQAAKKSVRGYWDRWQREPGLYQSKAQFARDMLDDGKHGNALRSTDVIKRWCLEWEKERTATGD